MSLKSLLEDYKYDKDFIYEGLRLDLSYYLKKLMKEKGITKKELAKSMNVSPSYVTKIFSGSNVSLRTVAKVLSALKVDARLILENVENRKYRIIKFNTFNTFNTNEVSNESENLANAG